ncbi:MAG: hypothetical protein PHE88_08135 [Elusimicrobia bacterium]|nr:hypothetical protein [Elusimicrobiota bacterium]
MLAVIGGIIAFAIGVILLFGGKIIPGLPVYMWDDFLICLKGIVSSGFVLGGLLAIIAGISAIKDKVKTEEKK